MFLTKCASLTNLDHVHVCGAAGHRLVHLPHLPVSLHSNHSDRHSKAPACENGRVHDLCVLQTEGKSKKAGLNIQNEIMHQDRDFQPL